MSVRVLLADDHPLFRDGITSLLSARDYVVVGQAGNGAEAARLVEELHPDLVLMDIRMPGINGLELLNEINSEYPDLPVIIMTAHSDLDSAVSAYQGGAFEYLPKPFDVDEAVDMVRRAVELRVEPGSDTHQHARADQLKGAHDE